jgi:hypothetical protein
MSERYTTRPPIFLSKGVISTKMGRASPSASAYFSTTLNTSSHLSLIKGRPTKGTSPNVPLMGLTLVH